MYSVKEERPVMLGEYITENRCTIREAAGNFGISKSTVFTDVTEKLKYCSPALYCEVRSVLDVNKAQRHIRGGNATKEKYKKV